MNDMNALYENLAEQLAAYQTLYKIQEEKQSVLANAGIAELDVLVNKEQVEILRAKSLETKREAILDLLGLKHQKLNKIIEDLPSASPTEESFRKRFRNLFDNLNFTLSQIKILSNQCKDIIESRLGISDPVVIVPRNSKNTAYNKVSVAKKEAHSSRFDKVF